MSRFFNTAGPCIPKRHYMLPPLPRISEALDLVRDEQYFILHAPRQSGKTTSLIALCQEINRSGEKYAVYCSLEAVAVGSATRNVSVELALELQESILDFVKIPSLAEIKLIKDRPDAVIRQFLGDVCQALDKPLVLLLDEVDAMQGESLLSLLRQLRKGYVELPLGKPFPASVALVGMRNIRDYRIQIRPESETLGTASPFNIVAKCLTLNVFTEEQIAELYAQHTAETGQAFEPEAIRRAHYWTGGQPWLVNAIARDCVRELCGGDVTRPVTAEMVDEAAYGIILRREVHIDSLLARLREPAVRRVLEPAIVGDELPLVNSINSDLSLVLDLGLLTPDEEGRLVPSNRIYAEVFLRTLSLDYQNMIKRTIPAPAWIREDGLDMDSLLKGFQAFWRENSEMFTSREGDYTEALPHLVLMGFLQRVVNGGGRIVREWAVGNGRLDLLVEFRQGRYPVELKIKGNSSQDSGIAQLLGYMDGLGVSEGWLLTFDRTGNLPWEQRLTWETIQRDGKTVHLVGA
ncbi:MAG: ATP-binding protein [Victivallales bacterium]|nr:ATP-binding protein [Victivallales bacterium]